MPTNLEQLPQIQMYAKASGEELSLYQSLSGAYNLEQLLVHREVLLPGRRASGPHFHSDKEEIFLVLAGEPSVWIGNRWQLLAPGDFIGFPPSSIAHMVMNRSNHPAVILTIGTNPPHDCVTFVQTLEAL